MTPPQLQFLLVLQGETPGLGAQLDSMAASGTDWRLLWQDEGTTDGAPQAIEAFAARHPGRVSGPARGQGLGPERAMLALLRAAPPSAAHALCAPGDAWEAGAAARALAALATATVAQPALWCGRRCHGADPAPPPLRRPPNFVDAMVQSYGAGRVLVLNAAGRRVMLAASMPSRSSPDWWAPVTVLGAGGRVLIDDTPAVRQVLPPDAAPPPLGLRGMRDRRPVPFLKTISQHLVALAAGPMTPAARAELTLLDRMRRAGPFGRLVLLQRSGARRATLAEDLLLWRWVLLRRMPRP